MRGSEEDREGSSVRHRVQVIPVIGRSIGILDACVRTRARMSERVRARSHDRVGGRGVF